MAMEFRSKRARDKSKEISQEFELAKPRRPGNKREVKAHSWEVAVHMAPGLSVKYMTVLTRTTVADMKKWLRQQAPLLSDERYRLTCRGIVLCDSWSFGQMMWWSPMKIIANSELATPLLFRIHIPFRNDVYMFYRKCDLRTLSKDHLELLLAKEIGLPVGIFRLVRRRYKGDPVGLDKQILKSLEVVPNMPSTEDIEQRRADELRKIADLSKHIEAYPLIHFNTFPRLYTEDTEDLTYELFSNWTEPPPSLVDEEYQREDKLAVNDIQRSIMEGDRRRRREQIKQEERTLRRTLSTNTTVGKTTGHQSVEKLAYDDSTSMVSVRSKTRAKTQTTNASAWMAADVMRRERPRCNVAELRSHSSLAAQGIAAGDDLWLQVRQGWGMILRYLMPSPRRVFFTFQTWIYIVEHMCASDGESRYIWQSMLYTACHYGHQCLVEYIIGFHLARPDEKVGTHPDLLVAQQKVPDNRGMVVMGYNDCPVHAAARRGHKGIVRYCIMAFPACLTVKDSEGKDVLTISQQYNYVQMFLMLQDQEMEGSASPVQYALKYQHLAKLYPDLNDRVHVPGYEDLEDMKRRRRERIEAKKKRSAFEQSEESDESS